MLPVKKWPAFILKEKFTLKKKLLLIIYSPHVIQDVRFKFQMRVSVQLQRALNDFKR